MAGDKETNPKTDAAAKPADPVAKERGKHAASAAQSFRRILHIEEMNKYRNDNFEQAYQKRKSEYQTQFADLSEERLKGLMEAFTRGYYQPEYNLMAEYQAKREKWVDLKEKEGAMSPSDKKEFEKLTAVMNMNEYEYIGSRILDHDVYSQIKGTFDKKELKNVLDNVDAPIREIARQMDESMLPKGIKRTHAATIDFFSSSKPELRNEIEAMKSKASGDAEMEPFKQASAILRAGMILHNPSGYLVSKGLSVIMGTKAMRPFAEGVKKSVDNMVEKSGIKASMKRHMQKLSPGAAKMIAGGVAAAAFGVLAVTGVIDPVEAVDRGIAFVNDITDMSDSVMPNGVPEPEVPGAAGISPWAENGFADSGKVTENNDVDIFWDLDNQQVPPYDGDISDMGIDVDGEAEPEVEPGPEPERQPEPDAEVEPEPDAEPTPEVAPETDPEVEVEEDEPTVKDCVAPDAPDGDGVKESEPAVNDESSTPSNEKYIVKPGDTLSEIIAERLEAAKIPYDYGMIDSYVDKVVEMNDGITDKDLIYPGSNIELPGFATATPEVSPEILANAQNDMTVMPEVPSQEQVEALKNTGLYPTNDPIGPTLQKASETLTAPQYEEPKVEDPSSKFDRPQYRSSYHA